MNVVLEIILICVYILLVVGVIINVEDEGFFGSDNFFIFVYDGVLCFRIYICSLYLKF